MCKSNSIAGNGKKETDADHERTMKAEGKSTLNLSDFSAGNAGVLQDLYVSKPGLNLSMSIIRA